MLEPCAVGAFGAGSLEMPLVVGSEVTGSAERPSTDGEVLVSSTLSRVLVPAPLTVFLLPLRLYLKDSLLSREVMAMDAENRSGGVGKKHSGEGHELDEISRKGTGSQ